MLQGATAGSDVLAFGGEAAALAHDFEGGENVLMFVFGPYIGRAKMATNRAGRPWCL